MIKRKLSKEIIKKEEYQIWNSFVDLLAMESEEDLTDIQKNAQRAFWYDSEVQNGGHLQYFENRHSENFFEVIKSLNTIGAKEQAKLLKKALDQLTSKERKPIKNILEYVQKANEDEYEDFDSDYYSIDPDINYYLEEYLKKYQSEFIEIE